MAHGVASSRLTSGPGGVGCGAAGAEEVVSSRGISRVPCANWWRSRCCTAPVSQCRCRPRTGWSCRHSAVSADSTSLHLPRLCPQLGNQLAHAASSLAACNTLRVSSSTQAPSGRGPGSAWRPPHVQTTYQALQHLRRASAWYQGQRTRAGARPQRTASSQRCRQPDGSCRTHCQAARRVDQAALERSGAFEA